MNALGSMIHGISSFLLTYKYSKDVDEDMYKCYTCLKDGMEELNKLIIEFYECNHNSIDEGYRKYDK